MRVFLLPLLLLLAVAVPPPAGAATPKKDTTYRATVLDEPTGTKVKVTIRIGSSTRKIEKLVVTLSCAEGKQKLVRRNIPIENNGQFVKYLPDYVNPTTAVSGQFVSKHKVDSGYVYGDDSQPCGGHPFSFVAKD